MVTAERYRNATLQAFRNVLSVWLGTLPPAGWKGSVTELEDALEAVNAERRVSTIIPQGGGLSTRLSGEVPFLESQGFKLVFTRTAKARTICIERTAGSFV